MQTLRLVPAPGLIVRDPETMQPLPPDGAEVPATEYWQRRLRDGDAIEAAPEAPQPKAAPKSKPTTAPDGANNQ